VVWGFALGVAHSLYDSLWGHPTFFPFLILGISVRIAESDHLRATITKALLYCKELCRREDELRRGRAFY
jgi:hypothetical protein